MAIPGKTALAAAEYIHKFHVEKQAARRSKDFPALVYTESNFFDLTLADVGGMYGEVRAQLLEVRQDDPFESHERFIDLLVFLYRLGKVKRGAKFVPGPQDYERVHEDLAKVGFPF